MVPQGGRAGNCRGAKQPRVDVPKRAGRFTESCRGGAVVSEGRRTGACRGTVQASEFVLARQRRPAGLCRGGAVVPQGGRAGTCRIAGTSGSVVLYWPRRPTRFCPRIPVGQCRSRSVRCRTGGAEWVGDLTAAVAPSAAIAPVIIDDLGDCGTNMLKDALALVATVLVVDERQIGPSHSSSGMSARYGSFSAVSS